MFCMPAAHQRHLPQPGRNDVITWSPTCQPGVFGPTCATIPAPSWPPSHGYIAGVTSPVAKWSSEWHMPDRDHLDQDLALTWLVELEVKSLVSPGRFHDDRTASFHLQPQSCLIV